MKKKKLLLLLLAVLLAPATVKAQNAVIIKMKDGSHNVVSLEAPQPGVSPTMTFEGDELVVTGGRTLRLKLSDILRYKFGDYALGIREIGNRTPGVAFHGDDITFSNQPAGTRAEVYTAGGVMVRQLTMSSAEARLSLGGLASGIYILKVGDQTYKIQKP
jgi:allophanate hydrolase subunit 2